MASGNMTQCRKLPWNWWFGICLDREKQFQDLKHTKLREHSVSGWPWIGTLKTNSSICNLWLRHGKFGWNSHILQTMKLPLAPGVLFYGSSHTHWWWLPLRSSNVRQFCGWHWWRAAKSWLSLINALGSSPWSTQVCRFKCPKLVHRTIFVATGYAITIWETVGWHNGHLNLGHYGINENRNGSFGWGKCSKPHSS